MKGDVMNKKKNFLNMSFNERVEDINRDLDRIAILAGAIIILHFAIIGFIMFAVVKVLQHFGIL